VEALALFASPGQRLWMFWDSFLWIHLPPNPDRLKLQFGKIVMELFSIRG
jgi:hypothetical protein